MCCCCKNGKAVSNQTPDMISHIHRPRCMDRLARYRDLCQLFCQQIKTKTSTRLKWLLWPRKVPFLLPHIQAISSLSLQRPRTPPINIFGSPKSISICQFRPRLIDANWAFYSENPWNSSANIWKCNIKSKKYLVNRVVQAKHAI